MSDLLTAVRGPALGMCWELTGSHVLGRDGDIAVDDPALSRAHLRLRARGGAIRCADAGSANGTFRRVAGLRLPLGAGWRSLGRGTVLELGSGAYRVSARPGPLRVRRWGADTAARLVVPLIMAAAMVPFAVGASPWRWAMVAAPLAAAVLLTRGRHPEVARSSHPAHVLLAAREGRAFHAEPVVPRELRAMRRPLAGTGWCLVGTRAEQQAIWLAGFLAVHNDPGVLRVTSPWITTTGDGLEVRFEPQGAGPTTAQAMVTWHRTPQWALVLRPPVWAAAGRAWAAALRAQEDDGPAVVVSPPLPASEVRRRWDRGRADLAVPLGRSDDGTLVIDLVRDGPHALVAGMTGSGKSELLTTWLLELAQRTSPGLLHMILVDFKGGAAFNHLSDLPHCVGVLTDLDPSATRRALASLRAQLGDRKRRMADAGCRDLAEFNSCQPAPLALLLVVIDEFRALAADHPDLMDQFLHLASQGRSLGVHLIAATQRPGGAVGPELRANMPLRVCLRVAEAADSLDVLGSPDAAFLEAPGQALVQCEVLSRARVAWSGDGDAVRRTVAGLAALWTGPPIEPPWCPPLPHRLPPDSLAAGDLALADLPGELVQRPVALPGALLVLGNPGTGRSAAALRAVEAALAQGDETWLVSADPTTPLAAGAFGGTLHPRGTRCVGQLLRHLAGPGRSRTLVFDDVELWMDSHDSLHGNGAAAAVLGEFLRSARAVGTRVVVAAPPGMLHARWAAPLTGRLLLAGLDGATAVAAGLPRALAAELAGPPRPGRAVLLPEAIVVQVATTHRVPRPRPGAAPPFPALPVESAPAPEPGRIVLGSDRSGTVSVPPRGDVVIVGPPGTGRTTTARLVQRQYPGSVLRDGELADTEGPLVATAIPAVLTGSWSSALARLRDADTVVLLRPDLFPRIPGPDYAAELEPGTPGYGVLLHRGRATALRLARELSVLEEPCPPGSQVRTGTGDRQRDQGGDRQHGHEYCEPREESSHGDHREDHQEVRGDEDRTRPGTPREEGEGGRHEERGHDDVVGVRPQSRAGGVTRDEVPDRDAGDPRRHHDGDRCRHDDRAGASAGHGWECSQQPAVDRCDEPHRG